MTTQPDWNIRITNGDETHEKVIVFVSMMEVRSQDPYYPMVGCTIADFDRQIALEVGHYYCNQPSDDALLLTRVLV